MKTATTSRKEIPAKGYTHARIRVPMRSVGRRATSRKPGPAVSTSTMPSLAFVDQSNESAHGLKSENRHNVKPVRKNIE